MNLAKMTIIGHIGSIQDIKTVNREKGSKDLNFSVAYNKPLKNSNNEYENQTNWYRCSLWNKQAEYWCNKINKGDLVYLEGEPSITQYKDKAQINIRIEKLNWRAKKEDSMDLSDLSF